MIWGFSARSLALINLTQRMLKPPNDKLTQFLILLVIFTRSREGASGGRKEGREEGRKGGREEGREEGREGGREGERREGERREEERREGGRRKGGREEGGREEGGREEGIPFRRLNLVRFAYRITPYLGLHDQVHARLHTHRHATRCL